MNVHLRLGRWAVLLGWFADEAPVFRAVDGTERTPALLLLGTSSPDRPSRDFLALWPAGASEALRLRAIDTATTLGRLHDLPPPRATTVAELAEALTGIDVELGPLVSAFLDDPAWLRALIAALPEAGPDFALAGGGLIDAFRVEETGGLVAGWAIAGPDRHFHLVDEKGRATNLDAAFRWRATEVPDDLVARFGLYAHETGFLLGFGPDFGGPGDLVLLWDDGRIARRVATIRWAPAPLDPHEFARRAFALATPRRRFAERLTHHDGPLLEDLIRRAGDWRRGVAIETSTFGARTSAAPPRVTVVVPLGGQIDRLHDQMLEFAEDPWFLDHAELICVADRAAIEEPLREEAEHLFSAYGVPFTVVWGRVDRSRAAALDIGVAAGTAPLVLLLGADVVPLEPDWLRRMADALEARSDTGILGARLLQATGGIHHDGIAFEWSAEIDGHVGRLLHHGLEPEDRPAAAPVARQAVSADCLLLRRATWDAVGGLDEDLLGDAFVDTDLCLEVRARGLDVRCLADVALVDLAPSPAFPLDAPDPTGDVMRFDAWRHDRHWRRAIDDLVATFAGAPR